MKTTINIKRAYEPEEAADGFRIYIDRLWPQGLSHETFHYDLWEKAISPSSELREWFHADPESRWPEFQARYRNELEQNPAFSDLNKVVDGKSTVTLLYSSRDTEHNNAVVLRQALSAD